MLTRYFVRIAVVYLLFTIGSSGSFYCVGSSADY